MALEIAAALCRQKAIRNNPYLTAWFFTCHFASSSLQTVSLAPLDLAEPYRWVDPPTLVLEPPAMMSRGPSSFKPILVTWGSVEECRYELAAPEELLYCPNSNSA